MAPFLTGNTPMGMLRSSANVVTSSARPSPLVSSRMRIESWGRVPGLAGNGYSTDSVTQSRLRSSKLMLIGLRTYGSAATNSMSKPGGR